MKRTLLASLTLIALGWMAGCGGGSILSSGQSGATGPNALNGQYAFVLSGFDTTSVGTGNPLAIAGSFKADGLGHITGGAVDVNDNGVISSSSTSLAGTYTINANGQGIISLTNTVGSVPHTLAFGFSLQTSGTFGDIIDADANNFVASGTMQLQSSSVFSLASLANSYIVTINGRNTSSPTSVLGRFTLASNGTGSNVAFDRSIAGVGTAAATSASVTLTSAPDTTNGRGTMTVVIDDTNANTTQNFFYYVITASRFIAVESDGNGTMTADASLQSALFPTTVNTAGAVFGMAGVDTATANEISAVGQLQVTGAGATGGTLLWDSNDSGTILGPTPLSGLPVTFDQTTGRGTITAATGFTNGLADSLVFYLSASGTGFILDATPNPTNRAMAGLLTAQVGSNFSAATDLPSFAIVRSRGSSVNDALAFASVFGLATNGTTSGFAFLYDQRSPGALATIGNLTPLYTVGGPSSTTGRGTLLTTNDLLTFYVIAPNQFVFIDSTGGAGNASPVFFAGPQ